MSTTENTPVDTTASDAQTTAPAPAEQDQQPQLDEKAGNEAAKYRHKLRDAEARIDQLAVQLEQARLAHLGTIFTGQRGTPSVDAIAKLGHDPADAFDETGAIKQDVIDTWRREARDVFGSPAFLPYVPGEGRNPRPPAAPSWQDAIAHGHR